MLKYKLTEDNFKKGDSSTSKGVKSTVSNIDDETGSVSWDIEYVPAFDNTFNVFKKLKSSLIDLAKETEDDKIDELNNQIHKLFNQYRSHLRKNYPDEYKKVKLSEMSVSTGAGGYTPKYAFKKKGSNLGLGPKAGPEGVKDNYYVKKFNYKLVPKDKKGNYVQKGSGLEVKNF